jgi:hypothetical protein
MFTLDNKIKTFIIPPRKKIKPLFNDHFEEIFQMDLEDDSDEEEEEEEEYVLPLFTHEKNTKSKIEKSFEILGESLWYYRIFQNDEGDWCYECRYCKKIIKYKGQKHISNHLSTSSHQRNILKGIVIKPKKKPEFIT